MQGALDGGGQLFGVFHLGHSYAGATGGGFHENGQLKLVEYGVDVHLIAVDKLGFGESYNAETAHQRVAVAFVESKHRGVEIAGGVFHPYHVEIALQTAVFARVAVHYHKSEVETYFLSVDADRKIVLVQRQVAAVVGKIKPLVWFDDNAVRLVFFFVESLENLVATAN